MKILKVSFSGPQGQSLSSLDKERVNTASLMVSFFVSILKNTPGVSNVSLSDFDITLTATPEAEKRIKTMSKNPGFKVEDINE